MTAPLTRPAPALPLPGDVLLDPVDPEAALRTLPLHYPPRRRVWQPLEPPPPSPPTTADVVVRKLAEWGRRYLLAEVAGTVAAVTAGLAVWAVTGSLGAAALAASLAETVGFYTVILRRSVPRLLRRHATASGLRRAWLTGRAVAAEASDYLLAESVDTLVMRPGLIYVASAWISAGMLWGLLAGKLLADTSFYAVVIPSYELRKKLSNG